MSTIVNCRQKRISYQVHHIGKRQKNDQELFAQGHLRRISVAPPVAVRTASKAVRMRNLSSRIERRELISVLVIRKSHQLPAKSPLGLAAEQLGDHLIRSGGDQGLKALIHRKLLSVREAVGGKVEDHVT
jgi:hypothetical protein